MRLKNCHSCNSRVFCALTWYFNQLKTENKNILCLYGSIDIHHVELSFHDLEHIIAMYVKEGECVKKGQRLVTQNMQRFQYPFDIAKANWEQQ